MTICMTGHTFTSTVDVNYKYDTLAELGTHVIVGVNASFSPPAKAAMTQKCIFGRLTDSRHYQSIERLNRSS